MSGHSKWHTTKRHKAVIDAKRGKVFSVLAKEISLAARAGGGSPETNARLRTLMDKARAANMPVARLLGKSGTRKNGPEHIPVKAFDPQSPTNISRTQSFGECTLA